MGKSKVIFWIAFIAVAALGGVLGYYSAMGEPTVFSQQYLDQEAVQAVNTNVVLAGDADIEIQYTYLMCGHKEKVELAGDPRFAGKTAKQIKAENPGCQIREFGAHQMVISDGRGRILPAALYCEAGPGKGMHIQDQPGNRQKRTVPGFKTGQSAVKTGRTAAAAGGRGV